MSEVVGQDDGDGQDDVIYLPLYTTMYDVGLNVIAVNYNNLQSLDISHRYLL